MNEKKIDTVFSGDSQGKAYLLKVLPTDFRNALVSVIEAAIENEMSVILVSVKIPYVNIRKLLGNEHIPMDSVFIVDTITKQITEEGVVEAPNVSYLAGPQNLANIGTSISVMAEKAKKGETVVIVDSLESMLTYNSARSVSTLVKDLGGRTETLEQRLVMFKQDPELDRQIGEDLYSIIDDVILLSTDEDMTVTVGAQHDTDDYIDIRVPSDVARSLHWEKGDNLEFTITRDGTLKLSKD